MSKTLLLASIIFVSTSIGWGYVFLTNVFSTNIKNASVEPKIKYIDPEKINQKSKNQHFTAPHLSEIISVNSVSRTSTLNKITDDHLPNIALVVPQIGKDATLRNIRKVSEIYSKVQSETPASIVLLTERLHLDQNQTSKKVTAPSYHSNEPRPRTKPKRPLISKALWTDPQTDNNQANYEVISDGTGKTERVSLKNTNVDIQKSNTENFNKIVSNVTISKLKNVANDSQPIFGNQQFLETQDNLTESFAPDHELIFDITEHSDEPSEKHDEKRNQETAFKSMSAISTSGTEPSTLIYISIGVYGNPVNLEKNIENLIGQGYPVKVQKVKFKNSSAAKLLSGPFRSRYYALKALKNVVQLGYIDAYISKG
jgi:hypothetical protein